MEHNQQVSELGPLLERSGLRNVVICPGSRNAPLIQLFTSYPGFNCKSIVDERSAAYYALGMSRQLNEPVAVLTTSGTAVLNLGPAVAEAHYQNIPLILITADRPRERLRQFNNQVINQVEPYTANSKGFLEIPADISSLGDLERYMHSVGELLKEGLAEPSGPVHMNIYLKEPLYEPLPEAVLQGLISESFPKVEGSNKDFGNPKDYIDYNNREGHKNHKTIEFGDQLSAIESGKKVLILAGMGQGDPEILETLEKISTHTDVAVIAENISNFSSGRFIRNPELILASAEKEALGKLAPDVVVMFGGQVVSKRLKLFLQSRNPPILYPEVDTASKLSGMFREFMEALPDNPGSVNREDLLSAKPADSEGLDYAGRWLKMQQGEGLIAGDLLDQMDFCNLSAIHRIHAAIPRDTVVHLGNSGMIRYSQLLKPRMDLSYYSNRGTSGIDGSVSTAAGAASVSERMHVLLLGDLSFVYDSNGLWNRNFPPNLKIIVFNDAGGGIFRLLEGPDKMNFFEEFSVTRHPVSIEILAKAFGHSSRRVQDFKELEESLDLLFRDEPVVSVLEVDTSGSQNSRIFKDFFNHIQENHA